MLRRETVGGTLLLATVIALVWRTRRGVMFVFVGGLELKCEFVQVTCVTPAARSYRSPPRSVG